MEISKSNKVFFAKAIDFEDTRLIRYLGFQRDDGAKLGSKFVDQYGKTNVLQFFDYLDGQEKKLDISSYSFYIDFRTQTKKVRVGDDLLVRSLIIQDPTDETHKYRRWIFQQIFKKENADKPDTTGKQEDPNGSNGASLTAFPR